MTTNAAVVGGGTMGVGIAYVLAVAGHHTFVVEPREQRRRELLAEVDTALSSGVSRGKLTEDDAQGTRERLTVVGDVADLPESLDLAIESIPEDPVAKRRVLATMEQRSPALLASNTSSISIDLLATDLSRPERFLGLHFFNPVWSIPLVEVVRGTATSAGCLADALRVVQGLGKQAAVVKDSPGFATSRLDIIVAIEAMRMLDEGVAEAADIDRAIRLAYKHPVGPLELSDIFGLDVRLDTARLLAQSLGERFTPPDVLIRLVEAGHLGVKTGRGFLIWPEAR